jgi:hypothetical protein
VRLNINEKQSSLKFKIAKDTGCWKLVVAVWGGGGGGRGKKLNMCPQSEFLKKKFKESNVTKTESTGMTQFTSLQFTTESLLRRPPLWSSVQSSWLQIRRPGFDSRHYQIFWGGGGKGKQVVGLERGPLSLVSTSEEVLDRKVAAPV